MSIRSTDASSRAASRAIKPMVDAIQLEAKTTGAAGRPRAAREGAHGFRLRAIAAEAGLGLSHVQYYFTSLDALLSALVDRYLADWDARLGETARDLPSAIDAVLDSQTQGEDCRLLWELWAMSSRDPAADAALTRFYAAYLDRVADLASAARPDLAPDTARDCAVLIVALIEGLSIQTVTEQQLHEARQAMEPLTRSAGSGAASS